MSARRVREDDEGRGGRPSRECRGGVQAVPAQVEGLDSGQRRVVAVLARHAVARVQHALGVVVRQAHARRARVAHELSGKFRKN